MIYCLNVCVCEKEQIGHNQQQMGTTVPVLWSSSLPLRHTYTVFLSLFLSLSISLPGPQPGRTFSCNCLLLSFQHDRSAFHCCCKYALQGVNTRFRVCFVLQLLLVRLLLESHTHFTVKAKCTLTCHGWENTGTLFNTDSRKATFFFFFLVLCFSFLFFIYTHCGNAVCWAGRCSK